MSAHAIFGQGAGVPGGQQVQFDDDALADAVISAVAPRRPSVRSGSTTPRVLFAEDFDTFSAALPAVVPEVISPSFTLADLQAARETAHQLGLAAGRVEAEQAVTNRVRKAMEQVMAALGAMDEKRLRDAETMAEALAATILAAISAALPTLCARHGEAEARAMVASILPGLTQTQTVHLRAHSSVLPGVLAQLQALRAPQMPSIDAQADDALTPGDITMTWQDGAATRSAGRICAEIDNILGLNGLVAAAAPVAPHSSRVNPARISDAQMAGQEHDHVR